MKIAVTIVTYNRLGALKETLRAYARQTALPARIIVVDNCSSDGTQAFLENWNAEKKPFESQVFYLPENRGGSGGFSYGMSRAMETDCDWVFIADDDAVPRPDVFERFQRFEVTHPDLAAQTAALCTAVYQNGHPARNHRCVWVKSPLGPMERYVPDSKYADEYFEVDLYTFVGTLVRMSALRQAGVARTDFFIETDDYEHAERVRQYGRLFCVPGAIMDHAYSRVHNRVASWRDYYATRNHTVMYKEHFGSYAAFWRAARRLVLAVIFYAPGKVRVNWDGAVDGFRLKTGLHPVYRPGWKPGAKRSS